MANDPQKAQFWRDLILTRCRFPAPTRLQAQFDAADLIEFCDCGCNSFRVQTRDDAGAPPLATVGAYGSVFEADFRISGSDKTIEIVLFVGGGGNLEYVEIDCCGNSFPVPEKVELEPAPFHVRASESLLKA